ncbi:MAG TPA: hypothetical protein DDZ88_12660 [Verrucomicrobiales bacterium]|nr:hypothetical protein [Verrucomicrobiales bacterium]
MFPDACAPSLNAWPRSSQSTPAVLSKIDHARELILEAHDNGIEFACVAMDSFYGRDRCGVLAG